MTRVKLGAGFSERKKFGNSPLTHRKQPVDDRALSTLSSAPNTNISSLGLRRRPTKSDEKENAPCSLGSGIYKFPEVVSTSDQQTRITAAPETQTQHHDSNHDDPASCWVLIYGFTTETQYNDILQLFSGFGQIMERRGLTNGPLHWAVLRFKDSNQVEAALLCDRQGFMSSDGHYVLCGVRRLANDDPILQYDELHLPGKENVCKRFFNWLFAGFDR